MTSYNYDLLVIGAGSGGVRASRTAAKLGAKVAIVEALYLGGTCVNVGCVPKKLFVYASHYRAELAAADCFGWTIGSAHFNWSTLLKNKNIEIQRLNQVYEKLLTDSGVSLLEGRARIRDGHSVEIGTAVYTAERILIATGGWPEIPQFPGCEHAITSNEVFHLDSLPKKIIIIGGGYIGVEFAGIFHGLGVETHICHRSEQLLKGFDEKVRNFVAQEMVKKGIHLHLNTDVVRIEKIADAQLRVNAEDGREWLVEQVMVATGRRPNVRGLGLENTRVALNADGTIQVNDFFQTHEPSIFALGDVVGRLVLTPVALAEGELLARNLYGGQTKTLNYHTIPAAVFCQPPVAAVGLTEAGARELYPEIDIYQTIFKPMQFSLLNSDEKVLIKIIVDRHTDKILGCHMVGPDAAEIMQGFAVALTAGATKKDFDNTLGIHPTLAEEFVTLRQPMRDPGRI